MPYKKTDWDHAYDWFAKEVGWFLISGCNDFPARGEVTGTSTENEQVMRFNGGQAHEEGGKSVEIVARKYEDGTIQISNSQYMSDCDGPLEHHWTGYIVNGEVVEDARWQRDGYAEMAGY